MPEPEQRSHISGVEVTGRENEGLEVRRVVIYARVGRGKVDGAHVVRLDRAQMKGVLPWLVRWACHAGTRDFCSALVAL